MATRSILVPPLFVQSVSGDHTLVALKWLIKPLMLADIHRTPFSTDWAVSSWRSLFAHHVVHDPVMKLVDAARNAKQGREEKTGDCIPKGVLCTGTGCIFTLLGGA